MCCSMWTTLVLLPVPPILAPSRAQMLNCYQLLAYHQMSCANCGRLIIPKERYLCIYWSVTASQGNFLRERIYFFHTHPNLCFPSYLQHGEKMPVYCTYLAGMSSHLTNLHHSSIWLGLGFQFLKQEQYTVKTTTTKPSFYLSCNTFTFASQRKDGSKGVSHPAVDNTEPCYLLFGAFQ